MPQRTCSRPPPVSNCRHHLASTGTRKTTAGTQRPGTPLGTWGSSEFRRRRRAAPPLRARAPRDTHHNLREGLQRGRELVGGRQGVWEVHGPGQDEQRGRDLLVQVQLQPLEGGFEAQAHPPPDPPTPAAHPAWSRRWPRWQRGGGGHWTASTGLLELRQARSPLRFWARWPPEPAEHPPPQDRRGHPAARLPASKLLPDERH